MAFTFPADCLGQLVQRRCEPSYGKTRVSGQSDRGLFRWNRVISTTDADTANPVYSHGGVSVDMFTYPTPYVLSVDNVTVSTLAVDNSYTVNGAGPLSVSSPGVLANDTEVFGGNLGVRPSSALPPTGP